MVGLAQLNDASAGPAGRWLEACCASPVWVAAMVAARPFSDPSSLRRRGTDELAALDWPQVLLALAAHPRIGDRATGTQPEARWSRQEQAGMRSATDEVRAELVAANRAYEERFGHVFLIFATGRTDTEMLAAARARLTNSDDDERAVVRAELARIVDLRLERLVSA